jgi:hypothetical protein
MTAQAYIILENMQSRGWNRINKENPVSFPYWWVWEIWTMRKNDMLVYLSFLIDPQCEKKIEHVWAVSAGKRQPVNRADWDICLSLGRKWENDLPEFLNEIESI